MPSSSCRSEVSSLTSPCVLERVQSDPLAADLTLSLFAAAVHSYRHDSVLRPFPPAFIKEGSEKDRKALEQAINELPMIVQFEKLLESLPQSTLDLLNWHFSNKSFTLKSRNKTDYYDILTLTGSREPTSVEPNYIFEVFPNKTNQLKFKQLQQGRKVFYAYHGSRIENFHSILHNGLASHMNKNGIFGEGTYLSSELSVSLHYSPSGFGWAKSQLGGQLSCVAVCEIIDDPSVKCQLKEGDHVAKRSRALVPNSMAGEVPEKYYVIRNNEVVKVKYLLIYADKTWNNINNRLPNHISWFGQHKFAVLMTIYVLLLVTIGLSNSKQFKQSMRRIFKS